METFLDYLATKPNHFDFPNHAHVPEWRLRPPENKRYWLGMTEHFLDLLYEKTRVGKTTEERLNFWNTQCPGWAIGETPTEQLVEAESCFFWGRGGKNPIEFTGICPGEGLH